MRCITKEDTTVAALTVLSVIALVCVGPMTAVAYENVGYYCSEQSTGNMDGWDAAAIIWGSDAILAAMVLTGPFGIGVAAGVAIGCYA